MTVQTLLQEINQMGPWANGQNDISIEIVIDGKPVKAAITRIDGYGYGTGARIVLRAEVPYNPEDHIYVNDLGEVILDASSKVEVAK